MFKIDLINQLDNRTLNWLNLATCKDYETRPTLSYLSRLNGQLVGCDGTRFHIVDLPTSMRSLSNADELPSEFRLVNFPVSKIKLKDTSAVFETPDHVITYPDIEAVMPKGDPVKVFSLSLASLRDAISQRPVAKDALVPVRFTIRQGIAPIELSWASDDVFPNGENNDGRERRHTAVLMPMHDTANMDAEPINGDYSKEIQRLRKTIGASDKALSEAQTQTGVFKQINEEMSVQMSNLRDQLAIAEDTVKNNDSDRLEAVTEFLGDEVIDRIVYVSTNSNGDLTIENERLEAENAQLTEQMEAVKAALS